MHKPAATCNLKLSTAGHRGLTNCSVGPSRKVHSHTHPVSGTVKNFPTGLNTELYQQL